MDQNIGVGIIIGLVATSSLYVYNSNNFTKSQKSYLLICIIFPPLQWLSILLISMFNQNQKENSQEFKVKKIVDISKDRLDSAIENLNDLKSGGIITESEYLTKKVKIANQKIQIELENSKEYKQLKDLLNSNILTNEEFENKIIVLHKLKIENENNRNVNLENSFIEENVEIELIEAVEISVWHKLTNFDKEIGKYITYEIQSNNIDIDKFEFNKLFYESKYFIFSEINYSYFDTVPDLIFSKFNITVTIK